MGFQHIHDSPEPMDLQILNAVSRVILARLLRRYPILKSWAASFLWELNVATYV